MAVKGYKIVFQWRHPDGPVGDQNDWRSWRRFAAWPMLFKTSADAWHHLNWIGAAVFRNCEHRRKISVTVVPANWQPYRKHKGGYHDPATGRASQ